MAVARCDYDHFMPTEKQTLGHIIDVHFNTTQIRYEKVRYYCDSQFILLSSWQYIRSISTCK